jgi:hypothetical protein
VVIPGILVLQRWWGATEVARALAKLRFLALRPLLGFTLACGLVNKARGFAVSVDRALTSGVWTYPPPRNAPSKPQEGGNFKTVEQGRNF